MTGKTDRTNGSVTKGKSLRKDVMKGRKFYPVLNKEPSFKPVSYKELGEQASFASPPA